MTPAELQGWALHLDRFPPGDFYLQHIMAAIWAQLESFFRKGSVTKYDIAPWLMPSEEREKLQAEQERKKRIAKVQAVKAAYLESLKDGR